MNIQNASKLRYASARHIALASGDSTQYTRNGKWQNFSDIFMQKSGLENIVFSDPHYWSSWDEVIVAPNPILGLLAAWDAVNNSKSFLYINIPKKDSWPFSIIDDPVVNKILAEHFGLKKFSFGDAIENLISKALWNGVRCFCLDREWIPLVTAARDNIDILVKISLHGPELEKPGKLQQKLITEVNSLLKPGIGLFQYNKKKSDNCFIFTRHITLTAEIPDFCAFDFKSQNPENIRIWSSDEAIKLTGTARNRTIWREQYLKTAIEDILSYTKR